VRSSTCLPLRQPGPHKGYSDLRGNMQWIFSPHKGYSDLRGNKQWIFSLSVVCLVPSQPLFLWSRKFGSPMSPVHLFLSFSISTTGWKTALFNHHLSIYHLCSEYLKPVHARPPSGTLGCRHLSPLVLEIFIRTGNSSTS